MKRFACSGEKAQAGGLEVDETIGDAAIHEAREEVCIHIAPQNIEYVHAIHSRTEARTWVGHFFQTSLWDGRPLLREPGKHDDLQWKTIGTPPENTIAYVRQALLCISRKQSYSEYGWE